MTYAYDTLNELTSEADANAGTLGFSYDALGRRTQLTRPNNVNSTYAYDAVSNLLSVVHALNGVTKDGASYVYDAVNNRSSRTQLPTTSTSTNSFTYDNLYELLQTVKSGSTPTTQEQFTYDLVGNRLTALQGGGSSYQVNSSNELTASPGTTYTYDANGNRLTLTNQVAGMPSTSNYTWDFENRLSQVTPGFGRATSFSYDPFGRRVRKVNGTTTTIYLYDGANIAEMIDANGVETKRIVHGPGVDEPLATVAGTAPTYEEADGLGSITSTSTATGSVILESYTSFGQAMAPAIPAPYAFTGREYDGETGLYYYRARYYDPTVGRFLSEDPIGGAEQNVYEYAFNEPTKLTDPSGLFAVVNNIILKPEMDLDYACNSAGACTTKVYASLTCDCKCEGAQVRAMATLTLNGELHVFSGAFPYKGRHPKDRSVHDKQSAIAHEYNVHINQAVAAVTPAINGLEATKFNSESECQSGCGKTAGVVRDLFKRTLEQTVQGENNQ